MGSDDNKVLNEWIANPKGATLSGFSAEEALLAFESLLSAKPGTAIHVALSLGATENGRQVLSRLPVELLVRLIAVINESTHQEKTAPRITWWSLRPVGKFPLFKASYLALLAVPLITKLIALFNIQTNPLFFAALYFGNLSLALGNLLFDLFCPVLIKRFESPNDLYNQMLEITAKQQKCYPDDEWIGAINHSWAAYENQNLSRSAPRYLSAVFYGLGFLMLSYVIVERSIFVLNLFKGSTPLP